MKQLPVCHEIAPYLRLPVDFLHTNQCNVDKHFRVSDASHSGFSMLLLYEFDLGCFGNGQRFLVDNH